MLTKRPTAPRLALRPDEAADSLGISQSQFYAQVAPHVRSVRIGRLRLWPVRELEKYLEREGL
jgi:excisionase family DNA binding protein